MISSNRCWRGRRVVVCAFFAACAIAVALSVAGILTHSNAAQARGPTQETSLTSQGQPVTIYFFWGDGCPHCAEAKPFLEQLTQQFPNATLRDYEVWYSPENQEIFWNMATAYGFEPSGVPTIFIGERYWIGYSEPIRDQIESAVAACSNSLCLDAGAGIIASLITTTPPANSTVVPEVAAALTPVIDDAASEIEREAAPAAAVAPQAATELLELPLIGMVDLANKSLAASTVLIAFVDGFNPCSLWVLSVLLALTLNTGSRKKIFWVGLLFLTVTSLIYMLFITGLFTIFRVVGFLGWIQMIVALVALFIAAINIKDYFWYKEGISFTIADEQKPGIYRRMRKVMDAGNSTWGLIGSTIVLAAGVSLVEFSCTAGFPILWTNLLITQQVTTTAFVLLLLLYMLIYQLDEMAIFLVAVFTLKASRLEESQGRILKLVGGMLMLTLAVVMLVNPALMSSLSTSLWVFVVAFGATGLVLLAHRVILPRFGVHIGTETKPQRKQKHSRRTA